tara:strand:+ start:637 stop:957 length:321 start_codon:yes stop_codon:yes gene_type:complete
MNFSRIVDDNVLMNSDGIIPDIRTFYTKNGLGHTLSQKVTPLYNSDIDSGADFLENTNSCVDCENWMNGVSHYYSIMTTKFKVNVAYCCKVFNEVSEEMLENHIIF